MSNNMAVVKSISCGGIEIDNQMRIGCMMYLEEAFGVPINEIIFGKDIKTSFRLFIGLALQSNEDMSEAEAKKHIGRLTDAEFAKILDQIDFGTTAKNSKTSAKKKRAKRKK